MIQMEQCPHCEKKMPKHILVKHLAKSHPDISITPLETKDEVVISTPEPKKWYELWNAGEIKTCAQCHEEWPNKLMGFHLKFEHGL